MALEKPRVLIVEDETILAEGLADALRFQGYECDVAADGAQGYEAARRGNYDVLLLDVMLPSMDGFAIMQRLRQEGRKVPTIMLTAKGAEEDRIHGLELARGRKSASTKRTATIVLQNLSSIFRML